MTEHNSHNNHEKKEHGHHSEHKKHDSGHHAHTGGHKKQDQKASKEVLIWQIVSAVLLIALVFVIFNPISPSETSVDNGETNLEENNNLNEDTSTASGKIKVTEYSDFECPFCSRFAPTAKQIKETYGDQIEFEYKHLALPFHPNAAPAAEASECAREQGKFWEYHDVLFENQQALNDANYAKWAEELGLDMDQFNDCYDSGKYKSKVEADEKEAQLLGISGTPTTVVNGELLVGAQPYETIAAAIDSALGGEVKELKTAEDDPETTLTVVKTDNCQTCDTAELETALLELFPKMTVETVEGADADAMVEELGLTYVPTFLFDQNVKDTLNYAKVTEAFESNGDYMQFKLDIVGAPVQRLEAIDVSNYPMIGEEDAEITIIEFSDFECPFCARAYEDAVTGIKENLVESGKAKLYFAHFPLESIHPNALKAHEASECARDQDKFWEYHDVLFETQKVALSDLKQHAVDLELDTDSFNECLDSGEKTQAVKDATNHGIELGVTGTPAFFVNGVAVSGAQPYAVFEQLVADMQQ